MRRSRTLPPDPTSVRAAREFATAVLIGLPEDACESIALMVSELATNSVKHARTPFELIINRSAKQVRVEVHDLAAGRPTIRYPQPEDPTGRGLQIVEMLSDAWGISPEGDSAGKMVWLTLSFSA